MKRLLPATLLAALLASPAYAMIAFLVSEWTSRGETFCKYDNGTVLNIGLALSCPLSINY